MRLTLRTLLAYLDDLLEPAETKEIGEKIKNSKDATDLIARIQEVMRRRRLIPPDNGLDPNKVAEYLDNSLSSEEVVDTEKVFLESDVHLAEVAAIQQIMTQVLSEPVDTTQRSLDRLYALIPSAPHADSSGSAVAENSQPANATTNQKPSSPESDNNRVDQAQSSTTEPKSFEDGIPDYLKQTPIWRRLLPYVAAVCIAGIWLGLVYIGFLDSSKKGDTDPSDNNQLAQIDLPPNGNQPVIDNVNKIPDDSSKTKTPPLPPQNKEDNSPKPPVVNNKQPLVPVIAKIPVVVAVNIPPAVPPEKQPMPAAALQYASNNGLLLHFDAKKEGWHILPRRSMIHPEETIASPQPFASTIKVGDDLCKVTLLGQTTVQTMKPTIKTSWGLSLVEGHLLIETKSEKEAFPKEGITLSLKTRSDDWLLKITSPETVCGVAIILHQPTNLEQKVPVRPYRSVLYIAKGTAQLIDAKGVSRQLVTGSSTSLPAKPPADKKGAAVPALTTLPDWLDFNKEEFSRTTRKHATLYEKEFDIDQSVAMNVPPLISDLRPRIAELAAQSLALTKNISAMVEVLAKSEHEEARLAAVVGLRTWMGTTPNTSVILRKELSKVFIQEKVDSVYRLLWGYSQDHATDRATSNQLVLWLEDDHVVIRELSFFYIQQLTGQKRQYRPLASPMQRASAIRRWKDHVEKRGALQKP